MSRFRSLLILLLAALAPVACGGQSDAAPARAAEVEVRSGDPDVRAALDLLAEGHPFRATQRLAPLLADSARRTPEVVLVAAAAAAAWEGWDEVRRLLEGRAWIDSLDDGRGRMLLTRAALEARDAPAALQHATVALSDARDDDERGERLTLLARALDQLDQRDSAARVYERAAALVPEVRDWLLLRAAGVESRADARDALYALVTTPAARGRVAWTELSARERFRDLTGAAAIADSLGARMRALRLRLDAAETAEARATFRERLIETIRERAGTGDAREAVEVVELEFGKLSPAEELLVARSASRAGPLSRAVTAYQRAFAAGLGTATDRLRLGEVLIRLDRDREAAVALDRLVKARTTPAPVAAAAAYQRGRALLRSSGRPAARTALRALRSRWPRDSSAANALYLLADMATDEGRDAAARDAWLLLVREHPQSRLAPVAAFKAAIVAMAGGTPRTTATELDAALARWPQNPEANAMRFWSGQAWAAAGEEARARERWRIAADADPMSYYAMRAAEKLGEKPWAPGDGAGAAPDSLVRAHERRAARLVELGMDFEARFEHDALSRMAEGDPQQAIAAGEALVRREQPSRAIALGWKLIERGIRDRRTYRLAYPVLERELIGDEAEKAKLDPALVAALVRQESSFNPRATSGAGARGLMQVMPTVGAALARSRGVAPWDPVLLYQPDVNVILGTTHLAGFLRHYPGPEYALAAYNAGPGRVASWRRKAGAADPLLFVERIPFVETRDYVRIVLRNRALYEALYQW